MIVTLKNRDITNGLVLLQGFMKRELSVTLSYAMAKTVRKLKEIVDLITEERQKLIEKHQWFDDDGQPVRSEQAGDDILLKDPIKFSADIEELMRQTNEVEVHQVKMEDLSKVTDAQGRAITPTIEEIDGLLLLCMLGEGDSDSSSSDLTKDDDDSSSK